jgi:hypothetical protein
MVILREIIIHSFSQEVEKYLKQLEKNHPE